MQPKHRKPLHPDIEITPAETQAFLDGDSKPDLLVSNSLNKTVSVLRNQVGEIFRVQLCPGASTTLSSPVNGTNYQWELDTGSGFTMLSTNSNHNGVTSASLHLNNLPSSFAGYQYRCVVNGVASQTFILMFVNGWTGSASTAWENGANWSCGFVPDANTHVVIPTGNVTLNSNTTIRTLKLGDGVALTIAPGRTLTIVE